MCILTFGQYCILHLVSHLNFVKVRRFASNDLLALRARLIRHMLNSRYALIPGPLIKQSASGFWHVNFVRDISNTIPAKKQNSTPLH
jgi:hypothetical protein